MSLVERSWYKPTVLTRLLLPLSWLFTALVLLRRIAYQRGVLKSPQLCVPVVVVGNISVGGTGKTPLIVTLVKLLQKAGYRPGIITRGYGGQAERWPQQVRPDSDPLMVGDEPVLLAQRCGCPVVAAPDRVAAAEALLRHVPCDLDLLLSDDGMQHYRLQREIEIAVIDGSRRFGNGHCLPAGPLREPVSRLANVDFIVCNGSAKRGEHTMKLVPGHARSLCDPLQTQPLSRFHGQRVHAVAGIGNPGRFFEMLRGLGMQVIEHAYPDHYFFSRGELQFDDDCPLLMTEKDGVKWQAYADSNQWCVPVDAVLGEPFLLGFLRQLKVVSDRYNRPVGGE